MHQDDDNYNDDHDYDDGSQDNFESQYKKYFKFDPDAWDAWGKMLYDALNEIVEYPSNVWYIGHNLGKDKSLPVNSYFSNTGKNKPFQYLGNNYQGDGIWKTKYFVHDKLASDYINHIQKHAIHFILQPSYYKGMFDILN